MRPCQYCNRPRYLHSRKRVQWGEEITEYATHFEHRPHAIGVRKGTVKMPNWGGVRESEPNLDDTHLDAMEERR
jgi:hypothetical protein